MFTIFAQFLKKVKNFPVDIHENSVVMEYPDWQPPIKVFKWWQNNVLEQTKG